MDNFSEPQNENTMQWKIWNNFRQHEDLWGGMQNDPHDHCDALYDIPYVKAGLELYQKHVPNTANSILEIGCAQGYILNHVGRADAERVGIDFNADRIRKGREQYPKCNFRVLDIRTLNVDDIDQRFDCILLPGVLEHMRFQDARLLIEKAFKLCNPGGKILFDLPWWDGNESNFDTGIHMNPSHAWVGTQYRWNYLFKGYSVQKIELEGYPFYVFGSIEKLAYPATEGILLGCWGKIGDILHSMPVAQLWSRILDYPVYVTYDKGFAAVGPVLDMLDGIKGHMPMDVDWTADDLGIKDPRWKMIINTSHNANRKDPVRKWNIFGWWDNGYHAIDFHSAFANISLTGNDRLLRFKDNTLRKRRTNTVVFLSNTGDPGMRGFSDEAWWEKVTDKVIELGGKPVEVSAGTLCNGKDMRKVDLGRMVKEISGARLVISVDTLSSALLAQSVGTKILRLYKLTSDSMTGTVVKSDTVQWVRDDKNQVPDINEVKEKIEYLWNL